MRELLWAAEERRAHHWDHTAELLACQINMTARKHLTTASQINPYRQENNKKVKVQASPLTLESLASLLEV